MTLFGDRIFTLRLQLRRIELQDVGLLAEWSHNEATYGPYLTPERHTPEQLRRQVQSGALWMERNKAFLVELRDGLPIGTVHYWVRPEAPGTAVIAVRIASVEERNKGYGTEAQKYLVLFLFNRLNIQQVEMYTDINNAAQQRCLSKLGFELIQAQPYSDQQVQRVGYLYRLSRSRFASEPVYQHHYA